MSDSTINVLDCYVAPQGEGPFSGIRTAFIRMSGCSVGCSWCDEAQTWKYRHGMKESEFHGFLKSISDDHTGIIQCSITGGEPLENPHDLEQIVGILESYRPKTISIETSGVYLPSEPFDHHRCSAWGWTKPLFILSPKPFALPDGERRDFWVDLLIRRQAYLKMVVGGLDDAVSFVGWMGDDLQYVPVWVQPMYARKRPEYNEEAFKDAYRYLWDHGYDARVTLQIHKHLGEK